MGLLKDPHYWGRAINRIEKIMPIEGEVVDLRTAAQILREACRVFSDLVDDPDFEKDAMQAQQLGSQAAKDLAAIDPDFSDFLKGFRRAETHVLMQSGVDMDLIEKILADVDELLDDRSFTQDCDRLGDKIRIMRDQCCRYAREPKRLGPADSEFVGEVKSAVIGIGIVGVDLGTLYTFPAVGEIIVGESILIGAAKCRRLLKRMW